MLSDNNMASLGAGDGLQQQQQHQQQQHQQQQHQQQHHHHQQQQSTATTRKSAISVEDTPANAIDTNIHDDSSTNNRKQIASTIHWFAQVGCDAAFEQLDDAGAIDREDRLRLIKDRQNEERQRKLEELKAQAVAAAKYREQKEEERRRRLEEMRVRELDRKQQVEERKRAIQDAEKDRREYILRKNQERDSRIETKRRNERSSIAFAFGSSTPRLLDPVDVGTMSNSSLWAHRRSTSISNVAYSGAPLSRRSSERELSDGGKKRATSAGGLDRNDGGQRQMSTSMYEVFNWGPLNDARPKRYSLAIAGSQIDIGDGPPAQQANAAASGSAKPRQHHHPQQQQQHHHHQHQQQHSSSSHNRTDDYVDAANLSYRSVARRKTDLMPTIPSPRDGFGSRSSLYCHTPRTPVRAVSMTRLDQLATPNRRNGEHIRAVIERQQRNYQHQLNASDSMNSSICSSSFLSTSHHSSHTLTPNSNALVGKTTTTTTTTTTSSTKYTQSVKRSRSMSRSLTHLSAHGNSNTASNGNNHHHHHQQQPQHLQTTTNQPSHHHLSLNRRGQLAARPLAKTSAASRSMSTLLLGRASTAGPSASNGRAPAAVADIGTSSSSSGQLARAYANVKSKMRAAMSASTAHLAVVEDASSVRGDSFGSGSRSGDVTPGTSRPGSALSTSTSVSGVLYRRSTGSGATPRKPRPASIAGTDEANKLRNFSSSNHSTSSSSGKEKPPLPRVSSAMRKSMTGSTNGLMSASFSGALPSAATTKETPKRAVPTPERRASAVRKTPRPVSAVITSTSAAPQPPAALKSAIKQSSSDKITRAASAASAPAAAVADATEVSTTTNTASAVSNENAVTVEAVADESTAFVTEKSVIEQVASSAVDEIVAAAETVASGKQSAVVSDEPEPVAIAESLDASLEQSSLESQVDVLETLKPASTSNGVTIAEPTPAPVVRQRSPAPPATPVQQQQQPATNNHHHHQLETPESHANANGHDAMTASMIKRISTAEEAKAALAERRRLAREEAERLAELERQRVEEEERAEQQRQAEEEERQRRFEEDTLRLVEEQRRAEEQRLEAAIEEAAQRELDEAARREEEERQRVERERDEQKAREEAERQKVEVAERLKKEEKEREERRKRVEAIMSRTRAKNAAAAGGAAAAAATPSTTPNKSEDAKPDSADAKSSSENSSSSSNSSSSNNSISATETSAAPASVPVPVAASAVPDLLSQAPANTLVDYEQSVTDKENTLIQSFSNLIISNGQQQPLSDSQLLSAGSDSNGLGAEKTPLNGKLNFDLLNEADDVILRTNGNNGHHNHNNHHHEHSLDNKIESTGTVNVLVDVGAGQPEQLQQQPQQLIDFSLESAHSANNGGFNNNNIVIDSSAALNLVNATATAVDSHEQKEISLL